MEARREERDGSTDGPRLERKNLREYRIERKLTAERDRKDDRESRKEKKMLGERVDEYTGSCETDCSEET